MGRNSCEEVYDSESMVSTKPPSEKLFAIIKGIWGISVFTDLQKLLKCPIFPQAWQVLQVLTFIS